MNIILTFSAICNTTIINNINAIIVITIKFKCESRARNSFATTHRGHPNARHGYSRVNISYKSPASSIFMTLPSGFQALNL